MTTVCDRRTDRQTDRQRDGDQEQDEITSILCHLWVDLLTLTVIRKYVISQVQHIVKLTGVDVKAFLRFIFF